MRGSRKSNKTLSEIEEIKVKCQQTCTDESASLCLHADSNRNH